MKGSEKMNVSSVVAGRDAAKVSQLIEAALDAIAEPIGSGVMANDSDSRALGRDHGLCAKLATRLQNPLLS
jgi:hypothetical protein